MKRRLPIGAESFAPDHGEAGVHVRVWAPTHAGVVFVQEFPDRREVALSREAGGYHGGFVPGAGPGTRYRFRLGTDPALHADPASRFQPEGPFGPSEVIDPHAFAWTDRAWRGIARHAHVLYELHIGTFTPGGTWAAAAEQLPFLAEVGITTIEVMPINEFAGRYGWGYDGVNLFAPTHNYGTPDDLRRFVDRAHALGLAVILDVVYNHFGPSGNSMFAWSPYYRSTRATEWGEALDFDGPHSAAVRDFFATNAGYWIEEFHLDGLRLDATQTMVDRSPEHVLAPIARRAREAGGGRPILVVGENEPQDATLLRPPIELDALWNDDFHHTSRVTMTGVIDGYLHDYRGTPQELVSAVKHGFLYQGQVYPWQHKPRGGATRGIKRHRFVQFLENHDQIANVGYGERLSDLTAPAMLRAMTALLLLTPGLPLLFQGQEVGARQPWRFFVDHREELREPVRKGRAALMAQFARMATPAAQAALYDPCDEATFRACILDPSARSLANPSVQLHRDLLRLRRDDPAFTDHREQALDGALVADRVVALRFFQTDPRGDRLLLLNLGTTFVRDVIPEPLIAPPSGLGWRLLWSSEDPRYGGHGTPTPFTRERLVIPARSALVLAADPAAQIVLDPGALVADKERVQR